MGYGAYNELKVKGSVSVPFVKDVFSGRLSFYNHRQDGHVYDIVSNKREGGDDQRALRSVFVYQPTDATKVRLSLYGSYRKYLLAPDPTRGVGPDTSPAQLASLDGLYGPTQSKTNVGAQNQSYTTKYWGGALQIDQALGAHTLTSITGYQDWKWDSVAHVTFSFAPGSDLSILFPFNDKTQSQELRLASPTGGLIDYQVGLYYFGEKHATSPRGVFLNFPTPGAKLCNAYNQLVETTNYAGFGEANMHLNDRFTVTAGLRWTRATKDLDFNIFPAPPGSSPIGESATPGITKDSISASNLGWRTGVQWKPHENHLTYVTVSRGFKGPGFGGGTVQGTSQRVRPEEATNFEVGWKAEWLDRRVTTDVAAFYTRFKDYQVGQAGFLRNVDGSFFTLPNGDRLLSLILVNAGSVISKGLEFAVDTRPVDSLTLSVRGAYVDAKYDEYRNAGCYPGQVLHSTGCLNSIDGLGRIQDLSGTRMPAAPKYTANASLNYEAKLAELRTVFHLDYAWRSEVQWSNSNAPQGIEPSYGVANRSIEFRDAADRVSLTLYGKNLFNKFHTAGIGNAGFGTVTHTLPQDYKLVVGGAIDYKF